MVLEDLLNYPNSYDLDDATKSEIHSYSQIKTGMLICFSHDDGENPAENPSVGRFRSQLTLSLMDKVT
jgi:hypothetical protein